MTGAARLVSLNLLYTETGWETLASRRDKHKLIMFYKMQSSLCPSYLSSLVLPTVGANIEQCSQSKQHIDGTC